MLVHGYMGLFMGDPRMLLMADISIFYARTISGTD